MLAAVCAAQQGIGLATMTKSLRIDGLEVLKVAGTTGNRYGVGIETIALTEAGPGQVSSLSFVIDDPQGELSIYEGGYVRLEDLTRGVPLFAGFIESFEPVSMGVGRSISVGCVGVEVVLDWMVVPAFTIPSGMTAETAIQSIIAQAIGVGVSLHCATTGAASANQTATIALRNTALTQAVAISVGTVRQAIQTVVAGWVQAFNAAGLSSTTAVDAPATVDFYLGLRVAQRRDTQQMLAHSPPLLGQTWLNDDYADIVFSSPTRRPANTAHRTDAIGTTRAVYVVGGNAAGTGIVSNGTGIPGQVAVINDSNSTTAAYRDAVGQAFLARNGGSIAGEVTAQEDININTAGAELRAGSDVYVTDPNLGLASYQALATQIDKVFHPSGAETWTIQYGGTVSGEQFIRRLTRSAINT